MRKPAVAAIILLLFSLPMLYITPGTTPDQTTETTTTTITSQRGGGTNYTVSLLTNQNFTGSATGWNYEEWGNNPEAASGSYFTTDYYGSTPGSVLLRLQYTSRQCELGWTQPFTYSGTRPVLSAWLTFRWKCYSYTYAGSTNYVEIYLECPKGSGNWQLITHTHFYSSTVWNYESKDISYYLNTYGPGTYQFEADAYLTTASSGTPNVRVLYDDVGISVKYNVPNPPTDLSVTINNGATYTRFRNVTLSLTASGADQMCFSNSSGGPWTSWESFATTKQVYLTLGDGSKNIYFKAKNTVGETGPVSDSITYDGSPPNTPSLTSPANGTAMRNNAPTFQWSSVTDNGPSLVASYTLEYSTSKTFPSGSTTTVSGLTGTSYTPSALADGTWYWHVRAVDNAGNPGAWSSPYYVIIVDTVYPIAPTLVSPTSGSVTNNKNPTFTWNAASDSSPSSGISNHTLQYSQDPNFSGATTVTISMPTLSYQVQGAGLTNGTWYWRVRATDKAGNAGGYAAYWTITVDTVNPGKPTLSLPNDGQATNNKNPTFTWSAATDPAPPSPSSGIASYTLALDTSSSFNNATGKLINKPGLTSTTYTLGGATLSDGTWYWHVRAVDNAGNLGDNSTYRSIIVDTVKPGQPTLLAPQSGTNTSSSTPAFTWRAATDDRSGIASYTLQIDNNTSYNSPVCRTYSGLTGNYTLTSPLSDGTWYWHVRAVDNAGNLGDYSTSNFLVVVDTVYPPVPILWSPTSGNITKNNKPTFIWNAPVDPAPSSGIAKYYLQLDTSSSFNNATGNLRVILVPGTTTNYNVPVGKELSDGIWYWRVNATDYAGNKGSYSGYWSLIVDTLPPNSPSLSLPVNDAKTNVNTTLLVWSAASDSGGSGVASYTLQIANNTLFNSPICITVPVIGTSYTPSALADGTWYWHVSATDYAGNIGSNSSTYHFMVDTIGPVAPNLIEPLNNETLGDNTPDFKWHVTTDPGSGVVASYTLQLDTSSGFSTVNKTTITGLTGNYTLTTPLGDDVWWWRVMAVDIVGNNGSWSSIWNLTVDTRVPNAPTLLSPANGYITNDNTTAFEWTKVSDASSYDLYVDESPDFGIPFIHKTGLTENYTLQELLNEDLGDGNWYWKVVAVRVGGNRSSTVWGLFVDTKNPLAPSLINPGLASYTNDTTPTFTWDPASDPSPPSGIAIYYLQLDDSSSFNSGNLRTILVNGTGFTPATFSLSDGIWYWRVNATDQAGNVGSYSTVRNFVVDTLPPNNLTLSATCGSFTKTLTITLTISAIGSPQKMYLSNDGSNWNEYDYAGSKAWTLTAGDGVKHVYFKCKDAAGNWAYLSGGFITITLDTVAPTAGSPSNPASGSYSKNNTPTFQWSAGSDSNGIANYTFQYSQDPTFSTGPAPVTVSGLSYSVTSPMNDGTWYWRVKATDNAGNVGGYSGYSIIVIDVLPPTPPDLASPNNGYPTNRTLTLTWNPATDAISGVAGYYLQLDTSPSFNSVNLTTSPFLSGTSYILTGPLGDDVWYWRVNATDRAGNRGLNSTPRSFVWDTHSPTIISFSLGGSFTNTLTITVTISASGTPQKMYLSNDGNDWAEYDYAGSKVWTLTVGDGAKTVYFKCKDAAGNWAYLSPLGYGTITLDTIPPTAGSLLAPASGLVTNDSLTTFQWSTGSDTGGSGVASYYLQYSNNPLFSSGVTTVYRALTSYTVSSRLSDGTWYWRVNATDRAGNTGPYSTFSSFTISTIPPDRVKSGYKPANNSLLNLVSPLFQWDDVIGAYRYHIQIDRSQNFNTSYLIENVTLSSNRFSPSIDNNEALNDSIWYWRVEALSFSGAPSGYSNISILNIDLTPPSNPQPISPPDQGATNEVNSHKFQWSKVQDAINYWVQLDSTPDFNSSDLYVLPGIEDPNCTINRKLGYGYWYWHVVALDPAGNIGDFLTTPTCRFIVDTISPSQPMPRSPVEGYLTNRTSLTFTWYEASDPTFNGVSSGVANYTLWLDNTTAFNSDNLRKITKLIGTSYNLTSPLRDGTWYWFVNATDRAGNTGSGSIIQRFTIDTVPPSPPPILSMSPNGVTVDVSKVTLTWNASSDPSGVTGYMIQIDISDKFDSVDRLEYKIGNQTTFTPDKELPNGQWYWRIAAIDAAGNLGAWSAPVPFVVNVVAGLSPMMIVIVGGGSSGAAILAVLGYVFYRRAKIPFVIKKIDQSIKLINKGEMPSPVPMRSRAEIVQTIFQDKVAILSKEKIEELEAKKGKRAPEKPEEPTEKKALGAKPKEAEPKKEVEAKPKAAKAVTPSEAEEANVDMIVKELEKLETKEEVEPSKESEFIRREREELEKPKKKKE